MKRATLANCAASYEASSTVCEALIGMSDNGAGALACSDDRFPIAVT